MRRWPAAAWWALASIPVGLVLVVLLVLLEHGARSGGGSGRKLHLLCAAGLRTTVDAVIADYREETGIEVAVDYRGSGALLAALDRTRLGDVFLPADDFYSTEAARLHLVAECEPVASQTPCVVVRKGNPHDVTELADLLRKDLRYALANPEVAAVGRRTRALAEREGLWPELLERATVTQPTVVDVARDVALGAVDAGVVWDSTARCFAELDWFVPEGWSEFRSPIVACVVRDSEPAVDAVRFLRFLTASDRGARRFVEQGFAVESGDPFEWTPRVRLMAGAMLRPAIQDSLEEFRRREGVDLEVVYDGCGQLVADMKTGVRPDLYVSCDQVFLDMVADEFTDMVDLSGNQLVLGVAPGNPKGIHSLEDLLRPGLRLGVANAQRSAMGARTRDVFERRGLWSGLRAHGNPVVESATGDLLVNQLLIGSLDVVVAWHSNVIAPAAGLEAIPLEGGDVVATQPMAISVQCRTPRLLRRLQQALRSDASRGRFEDLGFSWRGDVEPPP